MTSDEPPPREHGLAEQAGRGGFDAGTEAGAPTAVIQLGRVRRAGPRRDEEGTDDEGGPALIRVLLIDDDEDDANTVRDLLGRSEQARFVVQRVADLGQGLAGLLSGAYDIALVAYRLATADGLAPARLVARRGAGMPVILLGDGMPVELAATAVSAGAADVLEMEELDVERVERAIRMALARRVPPPATV